MTGLEIGLAIGLGVFVVFTILTWLGAAIEQGRLSRRARVVESLAGGAQASARMWSRRLEEESKARNELDQGIGRAIHRIIDLHLEEHSLRLANDPLSYLPNAGKQHEFIARGLLKALNILEEETGRYKEEEEEGPSSAYLNALKQGMFVRQSQEADRQRRQFVADQRRLQQERDKATAPYPTLPPFDGCKVCGCGAYTYRWGQCLTTWYSGNNEETTWATVEWQRYDPNFDVGWFPVCAHHASVLDKHGTVTRTVHGRIRRTGETPVMLPSPPTPGTKCASCHYSYATTHIWGQRKRDRYGLLVFKSVSLSCKAGEWLPVCDTAARILRRGNELLI